MVPGCSAHLYFHSLEPSVGLHPVLWTYRPHHFYNLPLPPWLLHQYKIILLGDRGTYAFSALMLLVGRQEGHPACKKTEWLEAGLVMCLGQGADLHMAQLMLLPLTISCYNKFRLVLPSWFYLSGASSPG